MRTSSAPSSQPHCTRFQGIFRGTVALTALFGLVLSSLAADEDDKKKLQGTWKLTEAKVDGKKKDLPSGATASMIFAGDKVTEKMTGQDDEVSTCKIDSSKKPAQIDLTSSKGMDKKSTTNQGIYKLEGDTLTVAYSTLGAFGKRPASFEGKEVMVLTFAREKEKEKKKDK